VINNMWKKLTVIALAGLLTLGVAGAAMAWPPPVSLTGIHVGFNHPLYIDGFGNLGGSHTITKGEYDSGWAQFCAPGYFRARGSAYDVKFHVARIDGADNYGPSGHSLMDALWVKVNGAGSTGWQDLSGGGTSCWPVTCAHSTLAHNYSPCYKLELGVVNWDAVNTFQGGSGNEVVFLGVWYLER